MAARGTRGLGHPRCPDDEFDAACVRCEQSTAITASRREAQRTATVVAAFWRVPAGWLDLAAIHPQHGELLKIEAIEIDRMRIHHNIEDGASTHTFPGRLDGDLAAFVRLSRSAGGRGRRDDSRRVRWRERVPHT